MFTGASRWWGQALNLALCWSREDSDCRDDALVRGLLWHRQPCRLLASISVNEDGYRINTHNLYGLTAIEKRELETHLNELGLKRDSF